MRDQPTPLQIKHRTLLTLWFALLMNVAVLFSMTIFLRSPEAAGNGSLRLVFIAGASLMLIASFIVRARILDRARAQQSLPSVHVAFVIAWAMCEASALLGLVEYFTFGSRDLVLFGIAIVGIVLHMPRIEHLESVGINK